MATRAEKVVLRLSTKKRRGALPEPGGACCWSGQGRGLAAGAPRAAWPDLLRAVGARGPRWCGLPGAGCGALRCSRASPGPAARAGACLLPCLGVVPGDFHGGPAQPLLQDLAVRRARRARPAPALCAGRLRGRSAAGTCACTSGGLARRASAACRGTAPRAQGGRGGLRRTLPRQARPGQGLGVGLPQVGRG